MGLVTVWLFIEDFRSSPSFPDQEKWCRIEKKLFMFRSWWSNCTGGGSRWDCAVTDANIPLHIVLFLWVRFSPCTRGSFWVLLPTSGEFKELELFSALVSVLGRKRWSIHTRVVKRTIIFIPTVSFHHEMATHWPLWHVWNERKNWTLVLSLFLKLENECFWRSNLPPMLLCPPRGPPRPPRPLNPGSPPLPRPRWKWPPRCGPPLMESSPQ